MTQRPIIVLFVGIPGSGKTTFAKQLAKEIEAIVLNSDAMRMSMWGSLDAIQAIHTNPEGRKQSNRLTFGAMNYASDQALAAGYSVIYDCNANRVWERQEKHDIAAKHGALSVVVRISVPYETALHRVQNREEDHDKPRISSDKAREVLDSFTSEIEEPASNEHIIKISGEVPFEEQYAKFRSGVESIVRKDTH